MRSILLFSLCFLPFFTKAQNSEEQQRPLAEIYLENLDLISFDTKDQFFASTTSGDIYQFRADGKQLNLFSPARQGRLEQLEAAWTVNIFSFSADLQEYRILDRFLNPLAEKGFSLAEVNLAKAATFVNNNVVWVWDESDLSLKSIDYLRDLIIQSQSLNLILPTDNLEVLEIREFKNRLFMNVANAGIFIFDNQANLMEKIELKTDQRLCFYREHLLWTQGGKLMAISVDTQEIKTLANLPIPDVRFVQTGQEKMIYATKDKIFTFSIPNWLKKLE